MVRLNATANKNDITDIEVRIEVKGKHEVPHEICSLFMCLYEQAPDLFEIGVQYVVEKKGAKS